MALNKNHQTHLDMMAAFEKADKGTPVDKVGNASYGFAQSSGMPRSPGQMASAKKAAKASALARGERAMQRSANKATLASTPAGAVAALKSPSPKPGVRTGGLGITTQGLPKKGLLSL